MPHEIPHHPTKITFAIGKVDVPLFTRYQEGNILTAAEANALNQLVQENTRNNLLQKWKRQDETNQGEGHDARLAEALKYMDEYEFGTRRGGRPSTATFDPVEHEAINILKRMIKARMVAQGKQVKGMAEKIDEQARTILKSGNATAQKVLDSARVYVAKLQEIGAANDLSDEEDLAA